MQKRYPLILVVLTSLFWVAQTRSQSPTEPLPSRWIDSNYDFSLSKADPRGAGNANIPLQIRKADFTSSLFETGSSRICIIVTENIASELTQELQRFQADLFQTGYSSTLLSFQKGDAQGLRQFLIQLYQESQSLQGAILMGDLPYIMFEMNQNWGAPYGYPGYERFPCDLFYMDMDGIWTDSKDDGRVKPDNGFYDTIADPLDLEIWVSRVRVDNLISLGEEIELLQHFLDQNHRMRHRNRDNARALAYIDDQWEHYGTDDKSNLAQLYAPNRIDLVHEPESTTAADYKHNQLEQSFELIHVRSHGSAYSHSFEEQNRSQIKAVSANDYLQADPTALFYSFFVCSAANFGMNNYLLGNITFNPDFPALVSWGSTKVGGMWNEGPFYEQLAEGKPIGQAFIHWFNQMSLAQPDKAPRWWYGMTLLGDASVHPQSISHLALEHSIDSLSCQDFDIIDIDQDDRLDLILYSESGVTILHATADHYHVYRTTLPGLEQWSWSDLDLDNDADLAGIDSKGHIIVWRNSGISNDTWLFEPLWDTQPTSKGADVSWYDVDQNGNPDLFYSLENGQNVFMLNKNSSPDGLWQCESHMITDVTNPLLGHHWLDFNADGKIDLLANQSRSNPTIVLYDGISIHFEQLGKASQILTDPPSAFFNLYDWNRDNTLDFYWLPTQDTDLTIADGTYRIPQELDIDAGLGQFLADDHLTQYFYTKNENLYSIELTKNITTEWGAFAASQWQIFDIDGDNRLEITGIHDKDTGGVLIYELNHPKLIDPPLPHNLDMSWSGSKVKLSWESRAPQRATKFRVRVGKSPENKIIFDQTFEFPNRLSPLSYAIEIARHWQKGSYYWSVQAIGAHGEKSDFTPSEFFEIKEQPMVKLQIKLFLQGLYKEGSMQSVYYHQNLLPVKEGANLDENIVDWIRLELRKTPDSPAIYSQDYLFNSQGLLIDPQTGKGLLNLNIPEGFYYLSLKHRNHLAISTRDPIQLEVREKTLLDFSTDQSLLSDPGITSMENGQILIRAGDLDQNSQINQVDISILIESMKTNKKGYLTADIDGDGWITAADLVIINNLQ
ncbi:hypothetical protein GF406_26910 [candidate division KSB1 bacterium]|nr:hypothetical protein [candidate division KSB1 bacterium]